MLRKESNLKGFMQKQNKEVKPFESKGNLPVEVVEILCQTTIGNALSAALSAISNPVVAERRSAVLKLLLQLSESDRGTSAPVDGSKLVRQIICATAVSFDNHEDRIRFYRDIVNIPEGSAEFVPELQFTAASLAFSTPGHDKTFSPLYADVFADLFIKSASVTTARIATYWQLNHWKDACKFFGEKCDTVAWGRPQFEMVIAVMDQVHRRITMRLPQTELASLFETREIQQALAMIINNLAHKRIAGMSPYNMLDFICQGIRVSQDPAQPEPAEE